MAVIIDGTTGVATPGVTDTGDLSVAGTTTLTTPLPVASGGTGASSLSGIAVGNLAGGSAGTIPYQSTVGTTAMLATGTSGQALISAGPSAAPAWGTPSTATNLAGGSAGTVPYQSASGTTAMLSAGTSGQVLTSSGAGAPSWTTPSAGAWAFISEVVSTSSTTVDFSNVFSSTYDVYMITATNVGGSTTNVSLQALAEFGAGSYTAYDYYNRMTAATTSTFSYGGGNVFVTNTNNTGSDAQRSNFVVEIYNPLSTNAKVANFRGCSYSGFSAAVVNWIMAALMSPSTSTQTGIRFSASSGTLTGTFRLYGLRKS